MSDYDFWDEGFDDMMSDQKKQKSSGSNVKFPISYVGKPGTYIFRLYPELYNGKPRMRRVVWSNQLQNYQRVLTKKGDNRIDDLVKEAKDRKLDSKSTRFWSHKRSQDAIMMGYIISAPQDKNIQPAGTASALIMNYKQLQQLDSFLDGLVDEGISLRSFLNPTKPSHAIKMKIDKVKKDNKTETIINISATTTADYELPPMEEVLPEGIKFNGLDDIHVKADAFLTDEQFVEFKKYYDEKVAKILEFKEGANHEPNADAEQGYTPQFDDDDKELQEALNQ